MLNILHKIFSFADWQKNHPNEPPPGDMLDVSFDTLQSGLKSVSDQVDKTRQIADRAVINTTVAIEAQEDAAGYSEAWARTSALWAEHMPDTIPASALASLDISGDHWSSRWWANQAANMVWQAMGGNAPGSNADAYFHTRAALVDAAAGPLTVYDGKVYTAGGYQYVGSPGAVAIPDLSGLLPLGDAHVEHFGAIGLTLAQLTAAAGSVSAQIAANNIAFQAADAYIASLGGGTFYAGAQFYVMGQTYVRSRGVYLRGGGCGSWETFANAGWPKTWEGTTLLFKGTGAKTVSFTNMTSGQFSGGWREDPDAPGTYFKLWSAYNVNASGSTPATQRVFSVAVLADDIVKGGLQYVRIANWVGTDGISGWSNIANTSLGDDWDFGYVLRDSSHVVDDNLQVVGGWREAAHFNVVEAGERGERNQIRTMKTSGVRGVVIRAPDRWKVTSKTASTIVVYWSNESYFPASGTFKGDDGVTYTYTSTTQATTFLTFNGVTPTPGAILAIETTTLGHANTEYLDLNANGLDLIGNQRAGTLGFPQSRALEISGNPLRGVKFSNAKIHTNEKINTHLHDCSDMTFDMPQFEGGGHCIASPVASVAAAYAAAPIGETRNLLMMSDIGLDNGGVDMRLFLPRTAYIQGLQLQPRTPLADDFVIKALTWKAGVSLQTDTGKLTLTDSGNLALDNAGNFNMNGGTARINYDAGQIFQVREGTTAVVSTDTGKQFRPGASDTQDLGMVGFKWRDVYALTFKPGAGGGVVWTSGAGSPNGVVTANIGSLYTRTDGGALTTLYVKESGVATNTGWVAK